LLTIGAAFHEFILRPQINKQRNKKPHEYFKELIGTWCSEYRSSQDISFHCSLTSSNLIKPLAFQHSFILVPLRLLGEQYPPMVGGWRTLTCNPFHWENQDTQALVEVGWGALSILNLLSASPVWG
jgi:hypothetical protein